MSDLQWFTDETSLRNVLSKLGCSEENRESIVSGFKDRGIPVALNDEQEKKISVYDTSFSALLIVEVDRHSGGEDESEGNIEAHGSNEGESSDRNGGSSQREERYRVRTFDFSRTARKWSQDADTRSATAADVEKLLKSFYLQAEYDKWDPQPYSAAGEAGSDGDGDSDSDGEVTYRSGELPGPGEGSENRMSEWRLPFPSFTDEETLRNVLSTSAGISPQDCKLITEAIKSGALGETSFDRRSKRITVHKRRSLDLMIVVKNRTDTSNDNFAEGNDSGKSEGIVESGGGSNGGQSSQGIGQSPSRETSYQVRFFSRKGDGWKEYGFGSEASVTEERVQALQGDFSAQLYLEKGMPENNKSNGSGDHESDEDEGESLVRSSQFVLLGPIVKAVPKTNTRPGSAGNMRTTASATNTTGTASGVPNENETTGDAGDSQW